MFIKTILVGGENLTPKQEKYRKLFMYLVSGGITTVVNWICFYLFDRLVSLEQMGIETTQFNLGIKTTVNQVFCWVVSVLTAFFLNRYLVFRSKGNIVRELLSFGGARVLSFIVLEVGLMLLMLWICTLITGLPTNAAMFTIGSFIFTYEYLVKGINSIFIVIANYVMSKLMVFRKEDMVDYNADKKEGGENA